jgi:hypothetical protein
LPTLALLPLLVSLVCRIRQEDNFRVGWIDALCINQENTKEKSNQVALMQDIYQRAERVLTWIGGDDGSVTIALELIDKAVSYAQMEAKLLKPLNDEIEWEAPSTEKSTVRGFPPLQNQAWMVLVELFERP